MHTACGNTSGQPPCCSVCPQTITLPEQCDRVHSLHTSQCNIVEGCASSGRSGSTLAWTKKCVSVSYQSTQVLRRKRQCVSGTSSMFPAGEYDAIASRPPTA